MIVIRWSIAVVVSIILLGSASCGGGSKGGPPVTVGVITFTNGTNDTRYSILVNGVQRVPSLAPGASSRLENLEAGSYLVDFKLAGTSISACKPDTATVTPGQNTIMTCSARECQVRGLAVVTLRNASTCGAYARMHFIWGGTLIATLGAGESKTFSATPGTATLRTNLAGTNRRACNDGTFTIAACQNRSISCTASVGAFRFRNLHSLFRPVDVYLGGVRVVSNLGYNSTSAEVIRLSGTYTVSFRFAGSSTRACLDTNFSISNCLRNTITCR